jgi:hypothetical protein
LHRLPGLRAGFIPHGHQPAHQRRFIHQLAVIKKGDFLKYLRTNI